MPERSWPEVVVVGLDWELTGAEGRLRLYAVLHQYMLGSL